MKQVEKDAVEFLLQVAQDNIAEAVRIVNNGKAPAHQDIAELIHAWGQISATVMANKAFHESQQAMLEALMGEPA